MKKQTLTFLSGGFLVLALSVSPLLAGNDGEKKGGPSVEERLSKMKQNLSLTDDQTAKLKVIYDEQKAKMDPIYQDASLSKEQKGEKARAIKEDTKAKVNDVLTAEQRSELKDSREERGSKKGQKKNY